eukprot:5656068-Pleurochrysis_carterae.AAC.3
MGGRGEGASPRERRATGKAEIGRARVKQRLSAQGLGAWRWADGGSRTAGLLQKSRLWRSHSLIRACRKPSLQHARGSGVCAATEELVLADSGRRAVLDARTQLEAHPPHPAPLPLCDSLSLVGSLSCRGTHGASQIHNASAFTPSLPATFQPAPAKLPQPCNYGLFPFTPLAHAHPLPKIPTHSKKRRQRAIASVTLSRGVRFCECACAMRGS